VNIKIVPESMLQMCTNLVIQYTNRFNRLKVTIGNKWESTLLWNYNVGNFSKI